MPPEDPDDKKKKRDEARKTKSVEELCENTVPGQKTSGRTKQYLKKGNYEDALNDFESLDVKNIKDIPTGKRGVLADGRDVNVRMKSSEGSPTLELFDRVLKRSIKIRYIGGK